VAATRAALLSAPPNITITITHPLLLSRSPHAQTKSTLPTSLFDRQTPKKEAALPAILS
jgi:hypothetical protein